MLVSSLGGKISYIEVNFHHIFPVFKMNEVLSALLKKSIRIMNIWPNIDFKKSVYLKSMKTESRRENLT